MNQLYFKINLNKFGEQRQKIENENRTFRNTVITFIIFYLAVAGTFYYFYGQMQQKVENRNKYLKKTKQKIESMQTTDEFLSKKDLERITKLTTDRVFWAKKLVALADKTTDDIAITHFSFKDGSLKLFGITKVDKDKKEFDLIDSFIASLRNDKQISTDFPDIVFVKSHRDEEKDVDILRFQVNCEAKNTGKKKRKR